MHFLAAAVTLFSFAGSSLSAAAPATAPANIVSPLTVEKYDGETSGAHIIQLNEGADRAALVSQVKQANGEVTHDDWKTCNGFAGLFILLFLHVMFL